MIVASSLLCIAEDRTWTDREGKFRIEAMLLDFDGKDVKLRKKENGKTVSIALEKLSLPDQAYVKKTMEAVGGASTENSEDPFAEVDDDAPKSKPATPQKTVPPKPAKTNDDDESATEENDGSGGPFKGKIPVTRLSTAPTIRTNHATSSWSAAPDPARHRKLGFKPTTLDFMYGKQDFFTHPDVGKPCFCDDVPEKILTAVSLKFRNDSRATKVFFGDMKTGLILSQTWPAKLQPFGLSPDGTRALFGQGGGRRGDDITHLTIADTTQPKLPCVGALFPFGEKGNDSSFDLEITWADWIDNQRILVRSRRGLVALLEAKNGAAVWTLDGSNMCSVTLSQGKKYLIVTQQNNSRYLLEALTGKPIGLITTAPGFELGFSAKFAFSLDGEKIAAFDNGWVHLWEMKNGAPKEPFFVGGYCGSDQELQWVSDVHLLCGRTLVETVEQLPIWNYSGIDSKDVYFGGYLWHTPHIWSKDTSFYVTGVAVPHPEMPKLPKLSDAQKFCVRPGLEINLSVDSAIPDSDKLREHVTQTLVANGLKVVPGASLTLAVRLQAEAPKEGEWGMHFGMGGTIGKATYTPYKYSYSVEQGDKTLWTLSSMSGAPMIASGDLSNRSLSEVVAEKSKPKSDWYFKVRIPKRIPFDKAGKSTLFK